MDDMPEAGMLLIMLVFMLGVLIWAVAAFAHDYLGLSYWIGIPGNILIAFGSIYVVIRKVIKEDKKKDEEMERWKIGKGK